MNRVEELNKEIEDLKARLIAKESEVVKAKIDKSVRHVEAAEHGEDWIEYHKKHGKDPEIPVKAGDIFYSSWGYDQTNINFYEVIKVSKSGKSVTVKSILARSEGYSEGYMTTREFPIPGSKSKWDKDPMTKRLKKSEYWGWSFKVSSYASAHRWDGEEKRATHYA